MLRRPRNRKALILPLSLAALFWTAADLPWGGSVADRLAGWAATRWSGMPVSFEGVRGQGLRALRFERADLRTTLAGGIWLKTGPGELRLSLPRLLAGGEGILSGRAKDVRTRLPKAFHKILDGPDLDFETFRFSWSRNGGSERLVLEECSGPHLRLTGAMTRRGRRVTGGELTLNFSPERAQGMPETLLERLFEDAWGWRGVRFVFKEGTLTLLGARGPLLEARWQ